ncbi:MAG: sensor histidine kinase, partial [Myxococcota bacterium]
VRSVLGFARRKRTEKWPCHPNRVVRSAVESYQKWSAPPHASLDLELAEDLSEVTLSPLFIAQALVNLLQNAAQAGGPEARLRVRTRLAGGELRFEVSDDGPGAPKGAHARVREPFFTVWASEGAAGPGLSLVDTIMADHGGRLDVEGGPGHGTTVALCIPFELGNAES